MPTLENWAKEYAYFEDRFKAAGFLWKHVEAVGEKARLMLFDMFTLFTAVKRIPAGGTYLEVGSWTGGSLCCAWEAAGDKINYISIDPFVVKRQAAADLVDRFRANTAHIPTWHIEADAEAVSGEIPDKSVHVLFIDGDHTYGFVKRDLLLYWPKVAVGGTMVVHDFNYPLDHVGVVTAVLHTFTFQTVVKPERSHMAVIEKREGNENLWVYGDRYGIEP